MSLQWFFVTGTDTDVGKTLVTSGLLALANKSGLRTAAVKPVAAGSMNSGAGFRNEDGLLLRDHCSYELSYDQVNPVALALPIAPHIAAAREKIELSAAKLVEHCTEFNHLQIDVSFIEGAGGWRVPLNGNQMLSDVAVGLHCKVILVVGLRLGCLNHAVLTAEAIRRDGLSLAGWVANFLEPEMPMVEENIATLRDLFDEPCLGVIPRLLDPSGQSVATYLMLPEQLSLS